tara:strand:- start:465 stop:1352 length:888 start_codon:yes stop_codon:yes gene_type:complete
MKNILISIAIVGISGLIFFQSCAADIRTPLIKKEGIQTENIIRGKEILHKAWIAQGFDKLKDHSTYSFIAEDVWKGAIGRFSKVWPDSKLQMQFKYRTGTFDGQVAFIDGSRKGEKVGLQNWNYYEIDADKDTVFQEANKKIKFGLAAYQYFGEMLDRLRQAPIISYAGEGELRGEKYDLVFCTWNKPEPHKEADQYIAWINQSNGLLEFTQYTIREDILNLPGSKAAYGGVEFSNFKKVDGILIPFVHTVYAFKLKEKQSKNLHQLVIKSFEFDSFDKSELELNPSLSESGNFK